VAVIGAGFTGSLTALHLLERGAPDLRIHLIERTPGFGPGLAYGTHNPQHLLNVRVGNMSAYPDQPGHLEHWLRGEDGQGAAAFVTRGAYGRYLASMLREAVGRADGARRLILEHDEAVDLKPHDEGVRLTLAMGRTLDVDATILAVGNPPPATPPGLGLEALPESFYAPDPWLAAALDGVASDAPVLLLGTGLTMVDIALALDARGHAGPVLAVSRRGLTPRRHGDLPPVAGEITDTPNGRASHLLRQTRRRAEEIGWREAVDELRPLTPAIWRGAGVDERGRFLRHLRPWWDVHRHRMAPAVADRVEALRGEARLVVAAGRILGVEARNEGVVVAWRPRGTAREDVAIVGRIINCTGPEGDPSRSREPLIRRLIDNGLARVDALGLGLEIDDESRLVDPTGVAASRLYAVGPITRGSLWEVTAVPDIRNQVADLARRLSPRP